jgi:hypothetical protein
MAIPGLYNDTVRVAYESIALAKLSRHPFVNYMNYWIAFNNCYVFLWDADGKNLKQLKIENGGISTKPNGSVLIPQVIGQPTEKQQIENAFLHWDEKFKIALVKSPATRFFVNRAPKLASYKPIEHDANGQKLNGVLDMAKTIDETHPVWRPIDIDAYERFVNGGRAKNDVCLLAGQILWLLYAVRNNLFHGSKVANDATDEEVVRNATALLTMILEYLLPADVWK